MTSTSFATVDLRIVDKRAFIEFNRPDKRNAMSPPLHDDMHHALDLVERHGDVRVLVISGRGDSFCAGMDLEEFLLDNFNDPEAFLRVSERALSWFRRLKGFNGVTLSAVNGWCIGGGMLVAGLCDISIAASDARFGLSEINFAVLPGAGLTWMTARHLSRKAALFYLLTGQLFDGDRAAEIGLVNYAVPATSLRDEVEKLSIEIAAKNRHAAVAIKRAYELADNMGFNESVEWEMAKFFELSYASRQEWLEVALRQFANKEFKPAKESYAQANVQSK